MGSEYNAIVALKRIKNAAFEKKCLSQNSFLHYRSPIAQIAYYNLFLIDVFCELILTNAYYFKVY